MKKRWHKFKSYLENENGQSMAEYALIISLIALAVISSISSVGDELIIRFQEFTNVLLSL